MPEQVKAELYNICARDNGAEVKIIPVKKPFNINDLEFDAEGYAKILNMKITIDGYIERMVNFAKNPIEIYVNGIPLTEIDIKRLEHDNVLS